MTEQPFVSTSESLVPSLTRLLVRVVLGLCVLLLATAVVAHAFRSELEAIGRGFVDRFGVTGMALGTMISDASHIPIPPQFYMLMGITSGVPAITTLAAVNIGSFFGGWIAYFLARRFSRFGWFERRLARPRELSQRVFERYGSWAPVVASFLPLTYAALCYLCGLSGLSKRGFALVTLIRVPRLIAYYYLVQLGWMAV